MAAVAWKHNPPLETLKRGSIQQGVMMRTVLNAYNKRLSKRHVGCATLNPPFHSQSLSFTSAMAHQEQRKTIDHHAPHLHPPHPYHRPHVPPRRPITPSRGPHHARQILPDHERGHIQQLRGPYKSRQMARTGANQRHRHGRVGGLNAGVVHTRLGRHYCEWQICWHGCVCVF